MAYLPSQPLANEYAKLNNSDFVEHSRSANFPWPELNVPQNFHAAYEGAVNVSASHFEFNSNASGHSLHPHPHEVPFTHPFSQLILPGAGVVDDQHILPVPNTQSLPAFSINNALHGDFAQMHTPVDSAHEFVGGYPSITPSSYDPSLAGPSSDDVYRWKQELGSSYRMSADNFHHSRGSPTSVPNHEWETPLLYQPLHKPSATHLAVEPDLSVSKSSLHCTPSARSSEGNQFNTRSREQANAAISSSCVPAPPFSHRYMPSSSISPSTSSSTSTNSQLSPQRNGQSNDLVVDVRVPYIKERTTFPGREYECCWESCNATLVPNPIAGEHPSNTQERFQDAIECHIEDHVWLSACGRKTRKRWDCRWGDCEEMMGSKRALIRHVGTHLGFRVLCDGCGMSYSRFDVFRRHQSRCDGVSAK